MLFAAKIVDAKTGDEPSIMQFIIRYAGYYISSFLMIGFIWIIFDSKNQGLHDKLAGTVVVRPKYYRPSVAKHTR